MADPGGGLGGTCPSGSWYLQKKKKEAKKKKERKRKKSKKFLIPSPWVVTSEVAAQKRFFFSSIGAPLAETSLDPPLAFVIRNAFNKVILGPNGL